MEKGWGRRFATFTSHFLKKSYRCPAFIIKKKKPTCGFDDHMQKESRRKCSKILTAVRLGRVISTFYFPVFFKSVILIVICSFWVTNL